MTTPLKTPERSTAKGTPPACDMRGSGRANRRHRAYYRIVIPGVLEDHYACPEHLASLLGEGLSTADQIVAVIFTANP